jgi:hypothetical protein
MVWVPLRVVLHLILDIQIQINVVGDTPASNNENTRQENEPQRHTFSKVKKKKK